MAVPVVQVVYDTGTCKVTSLSPTDNVRPKNKRKEMEKNRIPKTDGARYNSSLRNLSNSDGTIATVDNPLDDAPMRTRSGTTLLTYGKYYPINPNGIALTTAGHPSKDSKRDTPVHLDINAWSSEYGLAHQYLFTQYSMKKGLKVWGNKGLDFFSLSVNNPSSNDVLTDARPQKSKNWFSTNNDILTVREVTVC